MQFPCLASKLQSQPYGRWPETRKVKWKRGVRCMVNPSGNETEDKIIQWTTELTWNWNGLETSQFEFTEKRRKSSKRK